MSQGMSRGLIPPSVAKSNQFDVNRAGAIESIWQPLYDYQTYALAGTTNQYTFYAVPNGQGGKTFQDTNMEAAAMLPAPKEMLVTHIEVMFLPGGVPSDLDATVPEVTTAWNDMYTMCNKGYLEFFIGSKTYLRDGPISKFSNSWGLTGVASDAIGTTTADVKSASHTQYATFGGPIYKITPVKLRANQNFNVTLNFPTTATVSADARIGVVLGGFLYRLSQ